MCNRIAKQIKRKGFIGRRRCDLFVEQIEGLSEMTDAMVNEMDMTQQDFVNTGMKFQNLMQLSMNMKSMVKFVLQRTTPSERSIKEELSKSMGQWILNVGTNSAGNHDGIKQLSREALKGLRAQGISIPSMGALDDDEMDEEEELFPEDLAWAAAQSDDDASASASSDVDDDDGNL